LILLAVSELVFMTIGRPS